MSVLVRPDDGRRVALAVAAAAGRAGGRRAVRREPGVDAGAQVAERRVVEDRKLAGLLVERVETPVGQPAAVIGIGLNVSLRADELPVQTATSLRWRAASAPTARVLAGPILRNLDGLLQQWTEAGGDAARGLHAAYSDGVRRRSAGGCRGRRCRVVRSCSGDAQAGSTLRAGSSSTTGDG